MLRIINSIALKIMKLQLEELKRIIKSQLKNKVSVKIILVLNFRMDSLYYMINLLMGKFFI